MVVSLDTKVFDRLGRYAWWKGIRNDANEFCISCLECASQKGGHKTCHPPLQPILVGGPFHCVAVDILQLSKVIAMGLCLWITQPNGRRHLPFRIRRQTQ